MNHKRIISLTACCILAAIPGLSMLSFAGSESDTNAQAEQHLEKANELRKLADHDGAIVEYEKVISLSPNSDIALNAKYWIGQSHFQAGRLDASLAAFQTLLDEYPASTIAPSTKQMIERVEQAKKTKSLFEAVKKGDIEKVKKLILQGADVNAANDWGGTPLYVAAEKGHKDVAELLIAKGADVNARDKWGESVLEAVCWSSHRDIAELLVAKGADVNARDMWGWTPLYYAISYKPDKDIAKILIDNGADVNFVRQGNSYLHYTVGKNKIELTKLLVNNGANKFDQKNRFGYTPFYFAVRQGNREVIELFVSKGADVSTLHRAACVGDLNRVKSLVKQGADVDTEHELGLTPLFFAASLGQTEVAEFLIKNGADIHAKKKTIGRTALHQAVQFGVAKLAELLIAKGADVNAKDVSGQTPLHLAAQFGYKEVAQLLIAKAADINAKNTKCSTPLHLAAQNGHRDVAELLVAEGANVNAMDKYEHTPLRLALWGHYKEIVELLRKHGAKE